MPGNPERDCIHIGAVTGRIMALAQATRTRALMRSTAVLRCAAHQTARWR